MAKKFNRRQMLAASAAVAALPAAATALRVDGERLKVTLEGLSKFGRPEGGTFADGVSRTAYSDADIGGRAFAMGLMREAGLNPVIDPAGNIIGRTQTLPLAVYLQLEANPDVAIALSLVLLVVSLTVIVSLRDRWLGTS